MPVTELRAFLGLPWKRIKGEILVGGYRPTPVRRVEIPKSGGGVRLLGIPTALDRFIQQALLQVLVPIFDPTFSDSSYGFAPEDLPIRQWSRQEVMWRQEIAGSWIWIWKSSSTV